MALSNWDNIIMDEKGNTHIGNIKLKNGTELELYKSFVNIRNKKYWKKDCGFIYPVVGLFYSGEIQINGAIIHAHNNEDNNELFLRVYMHSRKKTIEYFAIARYGYVGSRHVGITKDCIKRYNKWAGRKLDWSKAMGCNQGDSFFVGEKFRYKIGKAHKETILSKMLKNTIVINGD